MSVDLESLDQPGGVPEEAGIVFHAPNFTDFYCFRVIRTSPPKCQAWKYVANTGSLLKEAQVSLTFPMRLRMTRLHDGTFLCYANGTALPPFEDTLYASGFVGLSTNATATFDNVAVHGQNAFWPGSGQEEPLIGDYFNHLNLDGMPFMWGLLGEHPTVTGESAWEVVDGGSGHGKVLKGMATSDPTKPKAEAFRGDRGWFNDTGEENEWMDYSVEAQVKLLSTSAEAGVCLRVKNFYYGTPYVGDRFYILRLDADASPDPGQQPQLQLRRRQWDSEPWPGDWVWQLLGSAALSNPTGWHTVKVEAIESTFACYLDGSWCFTATDPSLPENQYQDGLVGLWVDTDAALFDSGKVVDLRYQDP